MIPLIFAAKDCKLLSIVPLDFRMQQQLRRLVWFYRYRTRCGLIGDLNVIEEKTGRGYSNGIVSVKFQVNDTWPEPDDCSCRLTRTRMFLEKTGLYMLHFPRKF
ncbi:hypothetical protein AHAS_Ahas07G0051300 [Arachis hypogaea]